MNREKSYDTLSGSAHRTRNQVVQQDPDTKDKPDYIKDISFRGQPYRFVEHQNGLMGHLIVRIVAAEDLPQNGIGERVRPKILQSNTAGGSGVDGGFLPLVNVNLGRSWRRTKTAPNKQENRWTWRRETLCVECLKDTIHAGDGISLDVQACDSSRMSMMGTLTMATTGGGSDGVVALGVIDVSGLVVGDVDLLDAWVPLQPSGRLHMLIEYEPKGIQPTAHDVVHLESFARWQNSLLFPPSTPLVVVDTKNNHVLAAYTTPSGFGGRVRLHRNAVYVIERLSWFDGVLKVTSQPVEALMRSSMGRFLIRKTRPMVMLVNRVFRPLIASFDVALATAMFAGRAAIHGSLAIGNRHIS